MEKRTSIKANFIYNLIYSILNIIIPLLTAPYTSRVLGADKIGIYSYTYSLISTVIMIGALGASTYGQKEIASAGEDKEKKTYLFWEIFFIKGIFTAIVSIVFLCITAGGDYFPYFLLQIPFLIGAIFDIGWFFQGIEKFKYIAIRNMVVRVAGLILLFLLVKDSGDLWIYLLIIGVSQMLGNFSMWPYLRGNVGKPCFRKEMLRTHLNQLIIYFIPSIAYQIYSILDKAMLNWLVGSDYENGYYEQAYKIVNMVISVITSYTTVMRSRMSYLFSKGAMDDFKEKMQESTQMISLLVFPMAFGLAGIAAGFVPWFFGDGYDTVIPLLYIFCPIFIFMGYSHLIGTHLITPTGRQTKSSIAHCFAAGTNVVFNAILIPRFYAYGAAIASVISELCVLIVYLVVCRKEFGVKDILSACWKKVIAGVVMFFAVFWIGQYLNVSIVSSVIEIIAGAVIYAVVLVIIRDSFTLSVIKGAAAKVAGKLKKGD